MFLLLASCGGGSSGAPAPTIKYTQPPAFVVRQPITPLTPVVTGQVTSYSVSPALPAGLSLNNSTGVISGTPTTIAAPSTYTVAATSRSGSASASIAIAVNDVSPAIAYSSPYFAFTAGVSVQSITPSNTGGSVVTWNISPALPAGLMFSTDDGSISGVPVAGASPAAFVVSASNSGGQSTATVMIAIAGSPLLDLGQTDVITFVRYVNSAVLSQDRAGHWLLQNYTSGSNLANGNSQLVDLAGNIMIDETSAGVEIRASTDGHVLASIPGRANWWRLGSDGSYVVSGSATDLTAWSTSGQMLVSLTGDYSKAIAFAAAGKILVALGPKGPNVIEIVSTSIGNSSVTPVFQGVFNSWFIDGARFLTNLGTTVWTYSNSGVQEDVASLSTVDNLSGQGNWFWTLPVGGGVLNLYRVGASTSPTLSNNFGVDSAAFPSGATIGVLASGVGQLTVIDLSGSTPASASYSIPIAYLSSYGASSPAAWLAGNRYGVIFDGASLASQPRTLTLGAAWSIAGGTGHVSIATASGSIFNFNSNSNALDSRLSYLSSELSISTDGTILAAAGDLNDAQYVTDRSIHLYSLPGGTTIGSFSYMYPDQTLTDMSLSGSGAVLGEIFASPTSGPCLVQVIPTTAGSPIVCDNTGRVQFAHLSPDGSLVATSTPMGSSATTNIIKNGALVTAVQGGGVGWLDNGRLLVNDFDTRNNYLGATIFDSLGNKLGDSPIPMLFTVQAVTTSTVYSSELNSILGLTTGAPTWKSGNPSQTGIGAISGSEVVFVSGSFVLAQPF